MSTPITPEVVAASEATVEAFPAPVPSIEPKRRNWSFFIDHPEIPQFLITYFAGRGETLQSAEDLVQETAIRASAAPVYDSEKARGNPKNWAADLGRKVAIDAYRRQRRSGRHMPELIGIRVPDADHSKTSDSTEAVEEKLVIGSALAILSKDRQTMVLLLAHAYPQTEIAAILGVPHGTVKSGTYRALHELRQHLEADRTNSAEPVHNVTQANYYENPSPALLTYIRARLRASRHRATQLATERAAADA